MIGKQIRLERVMDRNTKMTVQVPLVHGVGMGPIEGIRDILNTVDTVTLGGANAVILHKGIVSRAHRGSGSDIGLIIHLTATTHDGRQTLVTSVEEAVRLGADAVSLRVEIGGPDEDEMLSLLGAVCRSGADWGMPVLALMFPKPQREAAKQLAGLSRAARIGGELGADVVRVPYHKKFAEVVSACPAPVIAIGGGAKKTPKALLEMVRDAVEAGARGVSVGRSIFQFEKPGNMIKAVSLVVHKKTPVEKALEVLKKKPIESNLFGGSVIW